MSNPYLHYALDMWFERVVKVRLRCEAHLVHYIDDFVICVQYRSDALRVQKILRHRLAKFGLILEPTKTKLVEFGRFAQRHADKHGRNRPETIYFFLGLTLYCTHDRKGNFKIGMHTEKSRLRCSLMSLQEPMWQLQHHKISDQSARSTPPSRAIMPITALPETFGRCSRSIAPGNGTGGRCCATAAEPANIFCDVSLQIREWTPLLRPNCASLPGAADARGGVK